MSHLIFKVNIGGRMVVQEEGENYYGQPILFLLHNKHYHNTFNISRGGIYFDFVAYLEVIMEVQR